MRGLAEAQGARRRATRVLFFVAGPLSVCAFVIGFWMLNQVLDAAVFIGREFVTAPWFSGQVDVWTYHDLAYLLLWGGYLGLATLAVEPWVPGNLSNGRVVATLLGFLLLTAGLWLAQDSMNASLVSGRAFVDLPFFASRLDLYQTRDAVDLLVGGGFLVFYALLHLGGPKSKQNAGSAPPL